MTRNGVTLATAVMAVFLLCSVGTAYGYTSVDFSISFHSALAPYGTWVNVAHYGPSWRPYLGVGFRPFTYGHWEYASAAPVWVGAEPWSWCAEHYGHWVFTSEFGWTWVPGYVYSPAPVDWSYGDGYVGWRPLSPPGFAAGFSFTDSNLWTFIGVNHFGSDDYSGFALHPAAVRGLFERRAVRVTTAPLRVNEMERIVRQPVRTTSLRERTIEVDHHRVRLALPASQESRVISTLNRMNTRTSSVAPARGRGQERIVMAERKVRAETAGRGTKSVAENRKVVYRHSAEASRHTSSIHHGTTVSSRESIPERRPPAAVHPRTTVMSERKTVSRHESIARSKAPATVHDSSRSHASQAHRSGEVHSGKKRVAPGKMKLE